MPSVASLIVSAQPGHASPRFVNGVLVSWPMRDRERAVPQVRRLSCGPLGLSPLGSAGEEWCRAGMSHLRVLLCGLAVVALSLVLVSCSDSSETTASSLSETSTSEPVSRSAGCIDGWVTPEAGTDLRTVPLDALRDNYGVAGLFVVDEMRYFEGPQDPAIIAPRYPFIRYWYVKASLQDDPGFRARWLLGAPPDREPAVAAVAPYESTGFQPGSWVSFYGESDEPYEYPGLPGLYRGVPYDSVSGIEFHTGEPEGGPAVLQPENVGCVQGT